MGDKGKVKIPNENETIKILEVLGHVQTAKKNPHIQLVSSQAAEQHES